MRMWMKTLLLAGMFTALLCGTAAAATVTGAGFYSIGTDPAVKVTAESSAGKVETTSANVDGKAGYETFYKGSDKLSVSCPAETGKQYLVLLVTGKSLPTSENTICYIDQVQAAEARVTFSVYPKLTGVHGDMTLFITSDDPNFGTKSVPLGYAKSGSYEMAPYKLGDANNSGKVEINDAVCVLQHIAKKKALVGTPLSAADTNKSGKIEMNDAVLILQHVAKKIVLE